MAQALFSFTGDSTGTTPTALVATGPSGRLPTIYGATTLGGASNLGTIFSLAPPSSPGGAWTEAVLYNFAGGSDSSSPDALAVDTNGVLYGATAGTGLDGSFSTVFSLTPPSSPGGAWTFALLGTYTSVSPFVLSIGHTAGGLAVLYITGDGVFSLTAPQTPGNPWTQATLSAAAANGPVAFGKNGVLYLTIVGGVASGSVFSLTPPRSPGGAWTSRTLHKFVSEEVNSPLAGVVIGQGGVLYGTGTRGKSDYSPGGVFSLTPPSASGQPWTYTGVVAFTNAEGRDPVVPLIWNNG